MCATHGDLPALASGGRFRSDLLYRVAGFTVSLPALRQRSDRNALISRLFVECGGSAKQLRLEDAALDRLAAYHWPGNVRELLSTLRSIAALAENGDSISVDELPAHMRDEPAASDDLHIALPMAVGESLAEITQRAIDRALDDCGQSVADAARRLGVRRRTVYRHRAKASRSRR